MTIADDMTQLADALATKHPEALDFSRASLTALEKLIKGKVTEATTRAWGAYVGECMRRERPADVAWVSYDEAAAANSSIAKMERGYDIEAILRVGKTHWFPLAKVEKFQRNGAQDSVLAFAGVALDLLPSTEARERADARRIAKTKTMVALGRTLAANLTAVGLEEFTGKMSSEIGEASWPSNVEAVRSMELPVDAIAAMLAEPAVGRGHKRTNPGHVAARWLAALAIHDIAKIPALPAKASKVSIENHTYARCYADLRAGNETLTIAAGASKSAAERTGALDALYTLANDWRMDREYQVLPFASFAPMVTAALAPKSPHLAVALDIIGSWMWKRSLTGAIKPALPAIKKLAAPATKAPPKTRQRADSIIDKYIWGIVHGHIPESESPEFEKIVAERRARR